MTKRFSFSLLLISLITAFSTYGYAGYTFTPYQCSLHPNYTNNYSFEWKLGTSNNDSLVINRHNCTANTGDVCPYYSDNLDYKFYILGNSFTKSLKITYEKVETEPVHDRIYHGFDDTSSTHQLSGTYGNTEVTQTRTNLSFQGEPQYVRLVSDGSVSDEGAFAKNAKFSCFSAPSSLYKTLTFHRLYKGLLMATHDVIYTRINTSDSLHTGGYSLHLHSPQSNDFDIYTKCGSLPTPTNYDQASRSGDSDEYLYISPTACSTTLYVAIHSYNGTGSFDFYPFKNSSYKVTNLRAGINFAPTTQQTTNITNTLEAGAKHFYGLTSGTHVIPKIDLYDNVSCSNCGGQNCDICFKNTSGVAFATSTQITMFNQFFQSPRVLSHEFGHLLANLDDEYSETGQNPRTTATACGHSMMGYYGTNVHSLCTSHNHKKNPQTGGTTSINTSNYNKLGYTDISAMKTTNNVDFSNHDFNLQLGQIISH